jgi:hypothetical protein
MSQTELKNLIELYTKKLLQLKRSSSVSNLKLPKLFQNNTYHNFIKRKLEKLHALNSRNKNNTGEKRIKQDLSSLFSIRKVNEIFCKKISKVKNNYKVYNSYNVNNSSFNSINTALNNSNTKTSVSNNGNRKNLIINKIKIIKIKKENNSIKSKDNNENDNEKQNEEHSFFTRKYYINKNNSNKDIYNLINTDNFNFFLPKICSSPRNNLFNTLNLSECEKNEN